MSKAANTRLHILQKAFQLIYRKGFQATSIDEIIASTQLTKGAFFYHFKNKEEMGLAMIKEVMEPGMKTVLLQPLENASHPVIEIYAMMEAVLYNDQFFDIKYGCPAINLTEEMPPLNPSFQMSLARLSHSWRDAIALAVRNGQAIGEVRPNVSADQVANFVMAGYGGVRNLGKIYGRSCYELYLNELKNYLETLR